MTDLSLPWQLPSAPPPLDFVQAVQPLSPKAGVHTAHLLWQRQQRDLTQLPGYLDCDRYTPTPATAFGPEMDWAIARIQHAHSHAETIAIWGDFDADGVTATAVLWEGLGQFFAQTTQLIYFIPNRLTESHGLSRSGLDALQAQGCTLVITCDTGSTNPLEIDYANQLGIDMIITDHHTLPDTRPPAIAMINPRYLPPDHPLAHLSGVAVAYKLVEALYATLPDIPTQPLDRLLDLVAIGLIADLVELKGDSRYLAQRGICQLQRQSRPDTMTRPGIGKLLEFCKRSGDRPTDISFGLGPRINAVSRIQGDAHFCVQLLTSRDRSLCHTLAEATELANTRRKAIQNDLVKQVRDRLTHFDLSTTRVIVLADEQWHAGVLGLVAGQIAQEYGRPTILLATDASMARGSARSVHQINLYDLVKGQEYLLSRFGGHPYAAGLSLPVENLDLFTQGINQQLRQWGEAVPPALAIDLTVTVADLGQALFHELKLLEPYGMGNPVPRLLLQNVTFQNVWNKKIQDHKGREVQYIKTTFALSDDTGTGFPGSWWGHYKDEIPLGSCDAVVELDWNAYEQRYEVRLVAVRPVAAIAVSSSISANRLPADRLPADWLLDWRGQAIVPDPTVLTVTHCPTRWPDLYPWFQRATTEQKSLAIAYPQPAPLDPQSTWTTLIGIAKYLSRTGNPATRQQLLDRLGLSDRSLHLALDLLPALGFQPTDDHQALQITWTAPEPAESSEVWKTAMAQWAIALREEHFHRQYFYQVPLENIQAMANNNRDSFAG
jgi:single-stranded-DNA-specific exonuclease